MTDYQFETVQKELLLLSRSVSEIRQKVFVINDAMGDTTHRKNVCEKLDEIALYLKSIESDLNRGEVKNIPNKFDSIINNVSNLRQRLETRITY